MWNLFNLILEYVHGIHIYIYIYIIIHINVINEDCIMSISYCRGITIIGTMVINRYLCLLKYIIIHITNYHNSHTRIIINVIKYIVYECVYSVYRGRRTLSVLYERITRLCTYLKIYILLSNGK